MDLFKIDHLFPAADNLGDVLPVWYFSISAFPSGFSRCGLRAELELEQPWLCSSLEVPRVKQETSKKVLPAQPEDSSPPLNGHEIHVSRKYLWTLLAKKYCSKMYPLCPGPCIPIPAWKHGMSDNYSGTNNVSPLLFLLFLWFSCLLLVLI